MTLFFLEKKQIHTFDSDWNWQMIVEYRNILKNLKTSYIFVLFLLLFFIFITQAITKHLRNSPLGAIFYTHTTHTSTLTQAFDHTGQWYWKCRWDVRKATTLPKSTLLWSIKIHILLFIEKKEVTCFLMARNETRFVISRASLFVLILNWHCV